MKKKNKKVSVHTESMMYDGIYIVLTIVALSTLIAPYIFMLLTDALPLPALISIALPSCLITLGYMVQALIGRAFRLKRATDNSAYEHTEQFFKAGEAAFGLILSAVFGILLFNGVSAWLKNLSLTNNNVYYDRYTAIPFMIAAFGTLCMAAGVVVWFFPFNRIISVRTIIPLVMVFLVNFLLLAVFLSGTTLMFTTVCLLIFIVCAFILLNQSNVIATFSKTKNTRVTPTARFYNVAVVIVAMLLLVAAVIGVLSVMTGITVTFRGTLLYVLQIMFNDEERYEDASEIAESFSDSVFNGVIDPADRSGNVAKLFFLIFFVIIIAVIIFFLVVRRREIWEKIKNIIQRISQLLIDFLVNLLNPKKKNNRLIIPDYIDEEVKIDENAIRDYSPTDARKKNLYRDFMQHLNTLQGAERVKFAYQTLVGCWREQKFGLEQSDTPREIMDKVVRASPTDEVGGITDIFETVKYAESTPESAKSEASVSAMCGIIKRYCR